MTLDRAIYLLLTAALLVAALSLLPSPWCWLALVPGAVAIGCVGWIERRHRKPPYPRAPRSPS